MGPAGVAGLVGEPGGGLDDPWRLERGGEEVDLLDRVRWRCLGGHHATSPVEPEGAVVVGEITHERVVVDVRRSARTVRATAGRWRRGRGR